MKTCPKCGAPQADILPTCDLCGSLFPGAKLPRKRFDVTGLTGIVSALISIAAAVLFFYVVETYTGDPTPEELTKLLIIVFGSMFFAATGPIAGFILSLVGIKKTKDKDVNGRGFAVAGVILSSMTLLIAFLFIALTIYLIVSLGS